MKKLIEKILAQYNDANLAAPECRSKIAEDIQTILIAKNKYAAIVIDNLIRVGTLQYNKNTSRANIDFDGCIYSVSIDELILTNNELTLLALDGAEINYLNTLMKE